MDRRDMENDRAGQAGVAGAAGDPEGSGRTLATAGNLGSGGSSTAGSSPGSGKRNNVRKLRLERMMSKAELARRAGLSALTVDRIERGMSCRMDTKRKVLEALGLGPLDRLMVFGEDD